MATIIAVGSGKGGVGKSLLSSLISAQLSNRGKRVLLIDIDFGCANLHSFINPPEMRYSLKDFISRKIKNLDELTCKTILPNLDIIVGTTLPGTANLASWVKQKMLRQLPKLDYDFVVLDLSSGLHFNTVDFFVMADIGLMVVTPDQFSVLNTYAFLKGYIFRLLARQWPRGSEEEKLVDLARDSENAVQISDIGALKYAMIQVNTGNAEKMDRLFNRMRVGLALNFRRSDEQEQVIRKLQNICFDRVGLVTSYIGSVRFYEQFFQRSPTLKRLLADESVATILEETEALGRNLLRQWTIEESPASGVVTEQTPGN